MVSTFRAVDIGGAEGQGNTRKYGPNTGKYEPGKIPYLDTFHAVSYP